MYITGSSLKEGKDKCQDKQTICSGLEGMGGEGLISYGRLFSAEIWAALWC